MELQEDIQRIKQMMGILTEDDSRKVLYSAVVLDNQSSEYLLNRFSEEIPNEWNKFAHHMTISFGKGIEDESLLGNIVVLTVTQLGISDMAIAVRVEGFPSKNKIPHITLAVNPDGGKPVMSNKIENWIDIEPFEITGEVKNVYNKS